jgi:hypothetical protein
LVDRQSNTIVSENGTNYFVEAGQATQQENDVFPLGYFRDTGNASHRPPQAFFGTSTRIRQNGRMPLKTTIEKC